MGLDISGIRFKELDPPGKIDHKHPVFVYKGFERSLLPHEILEVKYNEQDDSNYETVHGEFGMSYGSYNQFRRMLAKASLNKTIDEVWDTAKNLKDGEPYPSAIYHILNFADNEGYIGPTAVKELNEYFLNNYDKLRQFFVDGGEDYKCYLTSFNRLVDCVKETAAKDGYLNFH